MRKLILATVGLMIAAMSAFAQQGQGGIKATVTEAGNGLPIPFANVAVKQNGSLITGGSTDFDGVVEIKPISPGKYDVEITSLGFAPVKVAGVSVNANKTTFIPKASSSMKSSAIQIDEFVVVDYKKPLIEQDGAATTETVTSEEITRMAARSPADLAATAGGTYSKDDGSSSLNVRGGRSDANYYYIDGIKVRGSSAIPQASIEQVSVITGGLPAQYGDVTGGVVAITTKGVSRKYQGGVEVLTSGIGLGGDSYVGVDPYGYNLVEGALSGPLFQKRDSAGNKEPLVGFFVSGNFTSNRDTRPSAVGAWQIKDQSLAELRENPVRSGFTQNSILYNSAFLRLNDFEKVKVRPNTDNIGANLAAKIDVVTTSTTNLTFGGSFNYNKNKRYNYNQSLFASDEYPEQTSLDWRAYARFTQRFKNAEVEEGASSSLIKNAFYTIQADISQGYDRRWNPDHEDRFFDYGYVGKFTVYQGADYTPGFDSLTGVFGDVQQTFRDTLITFEPDTIKNPELARFTERYYQLYGWEGFDTEGNPVYDADRSFAFTNYNQIQQGGGLLNGDALDNVYGMWVSNNDVTNANGSASNNYLEAVTNQVRISGQGSADIGNHQFIVGFEYEQRVDRSYSISPSGLWALARLNANTHVDQLDKSNPIITYPGPSISYTRLNASPGEYDASNDDEPQSFIDYNLRGAAGLNQDGVDFLDVYSLDPELFKLEFFSPDELYRGGVGSLVNYYGYDPYGNRASGTASDFDAFFNERDEFGNHTRPIAPYQPIYVAGFIEDKFEFDDLIFRIGMRVDRFDANQQVLKDPFVLFPTIKAGENESFEYLAEGSTAHPGNIGEDYVVYVDNVQNPTAILGYRDGSTWYSPEGAELSDASSLRVSNGLPAPLLVADGDINYRESNNSVDVRAESFEDYKPQTNFMPRVAFSFPISDEANFFAHYDVLTKRPTTGNRLDPSDYYYLQSRASGAELANPNLKPEKTIDYEVGFQQALTSSMALKISAFYRESRDMVQVVRVFDAYPIEYRSFDNIDFATVKGLTISYDLRRTNNLSIRASYTLQFAEGTGSGATSQLNLARSGQPNLRAPIRLSYDQRHAIVANIDYRYADGGDYNGPVVGDMQILKNTGFNLQLRAGSGEPYNPQSNYTSTALFANNPSPLQKGAINSASLPWTFRFDFVFDRDFSYEVAGKKLNMNAYVQVLNLLNARNVNNVYRATGNPDDDGYLNSPIGDVFVNSQISPGTFSDYYMMKLWNPTNWQLPRRIRLGLRVNF